MHRDTVIPPNVLLQMPSDDIATVVAGRSGQVRVNELIRRATRQLVCRCAVEAVARQLDPMKRVRGNGGSRQHLAHEGIAIFSGTYNGQRGAVKALGLPEPSKSEFISTYLRQPTGEDPEQRSVGQVPCSGVAVGDPSLG